MCVRIGWLKQDCALYDEKRKQEDYTKGRFGCLFNADDGNVFAGTKNHLLVVFPFELNIALSASSYSKTFAHKP